MELQSLNKRRNFSSYEIEVLICCIEKHKNIIENKVTNAVTNKDKQVSWSQIEHKFNTLPEVTKRTAQQLINLYKNVKRRASKAKADEQVEYFKTGSGSAEKSLLEGESAAMADRLLALGAIQAPLQNPYDSDHHYHELTGKTVGPICDAKESDFSENEISMVHVEKPNSQDAETPKYVPGKCVNSGRFLQRKRKQPTPAAAADAIVKQATTKVSAIAAELEINLEMKKQEIELRQIKHEKEMELLQSQVEFYKALTERVVDTSKPLNICMNLNDNIGWTRGLKVW